MSSPRFSVKLIDPRTQGWAASKHQPAAKVRRFSIVDLDLELQGSHVAVLWRRSRAAEKKHMPKAQKGCRNANNVGKRPLDEWMSFPLWGEIHSKIFSNAMAGPISSCFMPASAPSIDQQRGKTATTSSSSHSIPWASLKGMRHWPIHKDTASGVPHIFKA